MNIKNKVMTAPREESTGFDLGHLLGQLIDHRWIIVAVTAFFMLVGTLYTLFATPIYSADAMVQVEQKNASTVLSDLQSIMPATPESDTEIQILESRMVIGKTVSDLGLDTVVEQKYFPIIGKGLSRLMGNKPAQIAISRLEIPRTVDKRSVELEVNSPTTYTVSKDGDELFKGQVGRLEQHGEITMLVSDIQADKGTSFTVTKLNELQAINSVLANLTVADKGKDTGVLGLEYLGEDPDHISKVLNQIVNNYLLQNVERKSEQAEKSLEFLRNQLPQVRAKLDDAENKLNAFRRQNESVDMSLEAKSALDSSVSVQSQLNELTFREAEVSQLFTKDHPTYRALLEKRKTLEGEQAQLNKKISQMPQTQQEILRLTRDVQSGQEIYMQLLNRQQELGISKASTVGDVRIIDNAETANSPVAPKKALIIVASLMLGLIVSVGLVLLKALLHHGIENPEQLEELGMNVYASVPLSEWQRKKDTEALARRGHKVKTDPHETLLALGNPTDLSIEAIRSLRTSLHFAMMEAKNNILMITGASPGIGKTFICANLATLVAKAGQRVLFIDGDMRRGYTHELIGAENKSGLSNLLSGKTEFSPALIQRGPYGFDFLPRGQVPPNPSELLMHRRMGELLDWASKNYDLVLIDTPPILAVTDASIIGKLAGTSLMVARFETNTTKEIDVSFKRFAQNGIEIKGVILNAVVRKAANSYGYGYDYYDYEYGKPTKS
ncbi:MULTISPECIES: tyrosine-protein kinase Wzc [Pantoea]|jgi:tyrosine-protein kinase Etk/Wzc|uniref:Tyrosine-protein kinase Wzc n=1 Tax=Pantoea piersonii TaxID=2364647 RepID=A0AAJ5UB92_9GAMM|nr:MULTISPECIES: tyrosine-protein kinase Wzc [Pantoea]MBZ6387082.1 tyrosine-protein kinase Wzc [Pantoea piersonii]MBZ6398853.1 tyrosine-protein kinase Wzc [Pantoea piersonii]MBZ6408465.1 tyrosine-protein kinase Wzc [Pantoea piersonii]MBZ6428324.1 tyrosine-protein kinase Wzc [Pantoea piersonii]NYB00781.1 tyrosine-protein kinase Wzc [Pantoea piersonii]